MKFPLIFHISLTSLLTLICQISLFLINLLNGRELQQWGPTMFVQYEYQCYKIRPRKEIIQYAMI